MNQEILACAVFAAFSIFMSVQDIRTQKVSRWCSVTLLVAMLVIRAVFMGGNERVGFIASAVIAIGVFWAVRLITKKKLGLADVFYSGSSGALLGFDFWLAACVIACVAAACVILFRVRKLPAQERDDDRTTTKSRNVAEILREPVPFIPCMFLGAIVAKSISFFA